MSESEKARIYRLKLFESYLTHPNKRPFQKGLIPARSKVVKRAEEMNLDFSEFLFYKLILNDPDLCKLTWKVKHPFDNFIATFYCVEAEELFNIGLTKHFGGLNNSQDTTDIIYWPNHDIDSDLMKDFTIRIIHTEELVNDPGWVINDIRNSFGLLPRSLKEINNCLEQDYFAVIQNYHNLESFFRRPVLGNIINFPINKPKISNSDEKDLVELKLEMFSSDWTFEGKPIKNQQIKVLTTENQKTIFSFELSL